MLWPFCLALGLVFGVAGLAKLRDPVATTEALTQFGISPRLAPATRIILPLSELAVATALFVPRSAAVGATAAGVFLVAFSVAVAIRLARGQRPECNCFGRLSTGRIGPGTLARNGALFALASLIAVNGWGHPERLGWSRLANEFAARDWSTPTIGLLMITVITVQGWLLLKLMRRHGDTLARIDKLEETLGDRTANAMGLPMGTKAPGFRLKGVHGEAMTLESLLAPGKPLMLMFTDPGCGPCATLLPDVARWQQEPAGTLTVALITRGDSAINRAKAAEHGLVNMLIQDGREISDAYRSPGTPTAVLIGRDGIIRSPMTAGADEIRRLLDETRKTAAVVLAGYPNGNGHAPRLTPVASGARRDEGGNDDQQR